jgi:hypothetical protein
MTQRLKNKQLSEFEKKNIPEDEKKIPEDEKKKTFRHLHKNIDFEKKKFIFDPLFFFFNDKSNAFQKLRMENMVFSRIQDVLEIVCVCVCVCDNPEKWKDRNYFLFFFWGKHSLRRKSLYQKP